MSVFSKFMTAAGASAALIALVAPTTPAEAIPMATKTSIINNNLRVPGGNTRETPTETLQRLITEKPEQATRIVQSGSAALAVKNGLPKDLGEYFLKCTAGMKGEQTLSPSDFQKAFGCFEKAHTQDTNNELALYGLIGVAMVGGAAGAAYLRDRSHMRKLGY
jgi:hypothetical protein